MTDKMKRSFSLLAFLLFPVAAPAQTRAPGADFQILKIAPNFISSPQFTYTGAEQYQADTRDRWLEMEVTLPTRPTLTTPPFR